MENYIETFNIQPSMFSFAVSFRYNDSTYTLEPKKDITAYELWNIYKLIKESEMNPHIDITKVMYERMHDMKIERHFTKEPT